MTNTIPRPEFPEPSFQREHWQSLNGEWEFSFDDDTFDQKIIVPFCYQSELGGIHRTERHHTVWYRRRFCVDPDFAQGALLLKFGAVDSEAHVWLNGVYLGSHSGGNTPFGFDITGATMAGENSVIVKVADYDNRDKPRGKQSWTGEGFRCWYTPTTGIWQSVWLEYAAKVRLERVKITPSVTELSALCEFEVSSFADTRLSVRAAVEIDGKPWLLGEQTLICRDGYGKCAMAFPDFDMRRDLICWSPEFPNLIDVDITVHNQDGLDDAVHTYFGLREVGARDGSLTLNGEAYYQRLVLDQGYWPGALMTPPSDEAIVRDIQLAKRMGFNGARKHQKIEDPRYYYWADKLGLLVWAELPSAFCFNDGAIRASASEMMDFVARDYNHPSIVAWVPMNESWGAREIQSSTRQQDYCRMLTYLVKAFDPMRPVSANDGWEQVSETDICAIHDYSLRPSTIARYLDLGKLLAGTVRGRYLFAEGNGYRGQPIVVSEYGGIAFRDGNTGGWGYFEKAEDEDAFLGRLEPVTRFLTEDSRFAGFCYTQLTDVMQETNGLLTEEREPKLPLEKLHSIFSNRGDERILGT